MEQPVGFVQVKTKFCIQITKGPFYGLKHVPRAWNDKLRNTLVGWGFNNSKCNTSLFFYKDKTQIIMVPIYVDDMIIKSSHELSL